MGRSEMRCATSLMSTVWIAEMKGDFVVTINPRETGGREARLVVEAKTGKLSPAKARAESTAALQNREAAASVLVFDSVEDAPLGGRHFSVSAAAHFCVVLDSAGPNLLALEVACRQGRAMAIAPLRDEAVLDTAWLTKRCERLAGLIEQAADIKRGTNAIRRGADKVDASYDELRDRALAVVADVLSSPR